MNQTRLLLLATFLLSGTVFSQDEPTARESWYTYWGLGYASVTYPGDLQTVMDAVEKLPGVERTRVGLDLLGFYFPINNHRTAVGFIINAAGDRLTINSDWVQINNYLYGASAMHFLNGIIGDGMFLRGDVGISKAVLQDNTGLNSSSESGMGFLIGGGYSIPVGAETRILINVNYSIKRIEGENLNTFGISVGGLF